MLPIGSDRDGNLARQASQFPVPESGTTLIVASGAPRVIVPEC
jgi:hypothetical protein